jgi:glyoxylase-like metal-dependent hydrolase (beta-lactamase superfamily II)
MNLKEIVPGLYLVAAENDGRFPYAHSLFVERTVHALIDTGCGEEVLATLQRERHIDIVIASHSHADHIALNWRFNGTPIYAPVYTADTFGDLELLSVRFAGQELASEWRTLIRAVTHLQTALPTHTYAEGHVFDFGKIKLVALHTPGHTADHMCLFEPNYGVMLLFDIDLTTFGPWYANPESDATAFEEAIGRVMSFEPRVVVSSHKGIFTDDIPARLQRYREIIAARDQTVRELLPRVRTLHELVDLSPFYRRYPYAARLMRYWEEQMIRKHLARLGVVLPEHL